MWHKFDRQKYKNRYRNSDEGVVIRVRIPMGREILGILEQRLGSCRVRVRCMDGRSRICRVPGRLKKKLWVKEGDVLLIEPWEFEGDEKGDVIFKYTRNQVDLLKKKGLMNEIEELEEF
ncbi:translation initiation factor eIF-1A [Candidatus Woesearchaeota archaeon]|nr:translation initiation factor eIF-1A [Candidatus Woesearchaeota archaeon]